MTPPHRTDSGSRTQRIIELLIHADWVHVDHVWEVSSLWVLRPEEWHAVWVSWLPTGDHLGWYINLQRPFTRTAIGFESMDLMLDVVVYPDGTWRWKDADEFEQIVHRQILDSGAARRIRDEADTALRRLAAGHEPFTPEWTHWRPEPSWSVPELSPGWDDASPPVAARR